MWGKCNKCNGKKKEQCTTEYFTCTYWMDNGASLLRYISLSISVGFLDMRQKGTESINVTTGDDKGHPSLKGVL